MSQQQSNIDFTFHRPEHLPTPGSEWQESSSGVEQAKLNNLAAQAWCLMQYLFDKLTDNHSHRGCPCRGPTQLIIDTIFLS